MVPVETSAPAVPPTLAASESIPLDSVMGPRVGSGPKGSQALKFLPKSWMDGVWEKGTWEMISIVDRGRLAKLRFLSHAAEESVSEV